MPLLARNVLMLVNLSPGITNNSPTSSTNGLIDIDNTSYTSASGANNRTNEFLMDGIPNNVSDRVAYIPSEAGHVPLNGERITYPANQEPGRRRWAAQGYRCH